MKISKTLKRLRAEKGITQEELAKLLFISRQSVSSWENDRTQPDIEMLGRLSEIFSVSIEELIYGKKRNITLETHKPSYNGTLIIVFSILGTLLAGIGIVLIFVHFWQKMPVVFKAILSFLPLIAGQGAGIFVLKTKKDKIPWCEGAGVLWCAGIAATLAMIYNIFDLSIYWYTLLIFISVSIIPVILLLRCVSPVAVYYACTLTWLFLLAENGYYYPILPTALLIAFGCVFTSRLVKKESKSLRSLYAHWISIAAVVIFTGFAGIALTRAELFLFSSAGALGLCLIMLSFRESDMLMPYRIPGLLLTSFMLSACSASPYGANEPTFKNIFFTVIPPLCALLFFIFSKSKAKNGFLTAYSVVSFCVLVLFSFVPFFFYDKYVGSNDEILVNVLRVISISANILLMISGSKEKKLIPVNVGFISVAVLTILIVAQSGLSLIGNGLLLVAFGAILLTINFTVSRRNRKKNTAEQNKEVSDDEQSN